MDQKENTAVAPPDEELDEQEGSERDESTEFAPPRRPSGPGPLLTQYKPDQGWYTRVGTFIGGVALFAWGAKFLNDRLSVFQGDEGWRLLVTPGIAFLVFAVLLGVAWWYSFVHPKTGDFMIATEGEMKKVSWSTRREVIGSTKVVILFTLLFAVFLFLMDFVSQRALVWIGVLKAS